MKCIIIEDEKPAQELLSGYIGQCPALELKGVYGHAMEAQAALNSGNVDLLFLDINLPLISGIDLLKSLKNPPQVIITTAYPEFAIEGFNLDVTDYLLKPFSFARFLKATNKALKGQSGDGKADFVSGDSTSHEPVILNIDKVLYRLNPADILYVASDRDYVSFHTTTRKYVVVGALKRWEEQLPNEQFLRTHKSYIVNLNHVTQVNGNQLRVGRDTLPVGRKYKSHFMLKFGKPS